MLLFSPMEMGPWSPRITTPGQTLAPGTIMILAELTADTGFPAVTEPTLAHTERRRFYRVNRLVHDAA